MVYLLIAWWFSMAMLNNQMVHSISTHSNGFHGWWSLFINMFHADQMTIFVNRSWRAVWPIYNYETFLRPSLSQPTCIAGLKFMDNPMTLWVSHRLFFSCFITTKAAIKTSLKGLLRDMDNSKSLPWDVPLGNLGSGSWWDSSLDPHLTHYRNGFRCILNPTFWYWLKVIHCME
jgi:hypothetical protein